MAACWACPGLSPQPCLRPHHPHLQVPARLTSGPVPGAVGARPCEHSALCAAALIAVLAYLVIPLAWLCGQFQASSSPPGVSLGIRACLLWS